MVHLCCKLRAGRRRCAITERGIDYEWNCNFLIDPYIRIGAARIKWLTTRPLRLMKQCIWIETFRIALFHLKAHIASRETMMEPRPLPFARSLAPQKVGYATCLAALRGALHSLTEVVGAARVMAHICSWNGSCSSPQTPTDSMGWTKKLIPVYFSLFYGLVWSLMVFLHNCFFFHVYNYQAFLSCYGLFLEWLRFFMWSA
jgi:hypothetical protein